MNEDGTARRFDSQHSCGVVRAALNLGMIQISRGEANEDVSFIDTKTYDYLCVAESLERWGSVKLALRPKPIDKNGLTWS